MSCQISVVSKAVMHDNLLFHLDEVNQVIGNSLQKSEQVRSEFHSKWFKTWNEYQDDIKIIEEELQQYPPSYEFYLKLKGKHKDKQKTREISGKKNTDKIDSHHRALDFHLSFYEKKKVDNKKNESVFLSKIRDDLHGSAREIHVPNSTAADLLFKKKKMQQPKESKECGCEIFEKFKARSEMIRKLDVIRDRENQINRQLLFDDQASSPLSMEERKKLTQELGPCCARSCEETLRLISAYSTFALVISKSNAMISIISIPIIIALLFNLLFNFF